MNQKTEDFTPEEKIKNEIELMKLKLEVENGAIIHTSASPPIPPEIELEWYNHIMHYEKTCKEAGYTTVYDMIGSPPYKNYADFSAEEIGPALQELLDVMYEKGIALSFLDGCYASEVLYRFITEELFNKEVCRYRGPGGREHTVFCYEEFYPNHEYDLHAAAQNLLERVFGEAKWKTEYLEFQYEPSLIVNNKTMSLATYSQKIVAFKAQYPSFLFSEKKAGIVQFDLDTNQATVEGSVQMNGSIIPFTIYLQYTFLWTINGFTMELIP